MGLYERARANADRLLTKYAQGTVTMSRSTSTAGAGPFDPPTVTRATETLNAVVRGVSQEFVDGDIIRNTDLQVLIKVPEVLPRVGDVVVVDDVNASVMRVDAIPGAGLIAAYRLIVRK